MNDRFMFLAPYFIALSNLTSSDRLIMYDAIAKYGLFGEAVELPPDLQGFFELIKPSLDRSNAKTAAAIENGKKGGAPKGNQNAKKQAKTTENKLKQANEQTEEKPPRSTRFIPPTVEEVRSYCLERHNGIDSQTFVDHYTANGWTRGKTKIKDWRACVRTWEQRDKDKDITRPDRYTYSEGESL